MPLKNGLSASRALLTSVCLATLSTGCASYSKRLPLPAPPASLVECAASAKVEIAPGPKTRAQAAALLADIRASELASKRCAADWAAWYDALLNGAS